MIPLESRTSCFLTTILALSLLAAVSGCITPDRWQMFRQPPALMPATETTQARPVQNEENRLQDQGAIAETPAPANLSLSLDQALVMALESNPGLRVEKYNPVLAGFSEEIARGEFDPELFSEITYSRNRFLETDSDSGSDSKVWTRSKERSRTAVIGIAQTFPTGTGVEATIGHETDDSYDGPDEQDFRLGLTVTQALLQGYGSSVNLAGVRQAELDTAASRHELRGLTEAFLADTEIAYWNHVLARKEIDIFEKSLDVARKQLFDVEQRIDVGTIPPIEAAAARAEVALREQDLIDARSTFEESRLNLLYYIHPDGGSRIDLQIQATSSAESPPEPDVAPAARLKLADRFRSDLQEARLRLDQQHLEIVKTRNGLLPRLDLFITLGKTGYADSFSASFKAMDDTTHEFAAGIRFSRPLGNRSAVGEDRSAAVTLKQAQEALENLRQIIHRDVLIALNETDRAKKQIAATRITRMHQEEALKAEQERFEVGASTGLLVAQVQRDLLASHIREVKAVIGYRQALVNLYLAEGSLLERRGICIEKDENPIPCPE